jgi:hypothetical protein
VDAGVTVVEFVRLTFLIFFREADLHFGGFLEAIIIIIIDRCGLRDFFLQITEKFKG